MRTPLDVHLYVTPRCNLSCPHCYYDAMERGRQPADTLDLQEIGRILTGLCERFDADVSLEGGEPFMRAGLGSMLSTLDASVLARITITTNGTVRVAAPKAVLSQLGGLRISIDGHTDQLQQELRGVEVAPVLATCASLRSMRVAYTVRMTLYRGNVRLLRDIYSWLAANEIARISLFEYQASGRGIGQDQMFGVSSSDIEQLLSDLLRLPRPPGLELLTLNLAQRRVESAMSRQEELSDAGVGLLQLPENANCTINYNGTVGVSPWLVTASGSPDIFTSTHSPTFLDEIEQAAVRGGLHDAGPCLSRIQLRYER
ncbi:MAG: radical SAM protein [Kineosporiaceae bacterium]|nr:radical SAM protein [Kineosporiaceae bacterium]